MAKEKMKIHIMNKKPYILIKSSAGFIPLYKSLCGIKEPHSQVYGSVIPTCKRCIKIQEGKKEHETTRIYM